MDTPHTKPKHTRAKVKPKKTKTKCLRRTPKGAGGTKGGKETGTSKTSPPTHNLSTQSQEQSQAKQHLGPALKT